MILSLIIDILLSINRGFSTVDLIEDAASHKLYALKRITCHSQEDQKVVYLFFILVLGTYLFYLCLICCKIYCSYYLWL